MILQFISGLLASLPAIVKILEQLDKWFVATPAEKAIKDYKDAVVARKEAASKRNEAIKGAKTSYTKDIEDIFNRNN